ncbi:MAG: hypothetical protein V7603_6183 [Micromonosporaceae bacterium]
MVELSLLIERMQRASETAGSAADVYRCYEALTGEESSDGLLVKSLVQGFGVPLRIAMTATDWRGFGLDHGLDDEELERLVGRWLHD